MWSTPLQDGSASTSKHLREITTPTPPTTREQQRQRQRQVSQSPFLEWLTSILTVQQPLGCSDEDATIAIKSQSLTTVLPVSHQLLPSFFFNSQMQNLKKKMTVLFRKVSDRPFPLWCSSKNTLIFSFLPQILAELKWACINVITCFITAVNLLSAGSAEFLTQGFSDLSPHGLPFWLWLLLLFVFIVYAEARCCRPSSLHEARGWVPRWILMYQLVHGKHHFLIQAASIGFTFRETKSPTRPQRMFTTGSEGMKQNKIQKVLVWMATMELTVWGASSSSQP